jgi:hypothetical protein
MTTVPKTAVIPAQRSNTASLPWFTGDVSAIAARLRAAASERPDGDCVQAVTYIEAIQEHAKLSGAAKARLTAAVIEAVQLVRGWDAPLAVDDAEPTAAPAVDAPAEAPEAGPVPVQEAIERGDVPAIAAHLRAGRDRYQEASAYRPDGDCFEAIVLIEGIHDRTLPAAEKNRRTVAVLAAVRAVRGWAS